MFVLYLKQTAMVVCRNLSISSTQEGCWQGVCFLSHGRLKWLGRNLCFNHRGGKKGAGWEFDFFH